MRLFSLIALTLTAAFTLGCANTQERDIFVASILMNSADTISSQITASPEMAADTAGFLLVRGLFEDNIDLVEKAFSLGADIHQPLKNPQLLMYLMVKQDLHEFTANPQGVHFALYDIHCKTSKECHYNYNHLFSPMDMVQSPEALALMKKHGAGEQTQDNKDHAFAMATFTGNTKGMAYLQKQGANISRSYPTGRTPLDLAVAAGRINSLEWLLNRGVSPNTTRRIELVSSYVNRPIAMDAATPLHLAAHLQPWAIHNEATFTARNNIIKTLLKYKANPNATSSYSDMAANARQLEMQQATPLHVAMFSAGNAQSTDIKQGQEQLADTLRKGGANANLTNDKGQTPEALYRQIADMRAAHTQKLRQQHAQRQLQQQQKDSNTINPGRFIAGAAMIGLGAYGANQGGDMGMRAIEISGAGLADIVSDGKTNHTQQTLERAKQQTPQQTGVAGATPPAAGFQQETYTFTCPSGQREEIPLHFRTQACRTAMIDFARAYSCNEYNRFDQVHSGCQSACGDRNCLQK